MLIHLKHVLAHREPLQGQCKIEISSRLPVFLQEPCQLDCAYQIIAEQDYYVLTMHLQGQLQCVCQRCLQVFQQGYDNTIRIAICTTELRAEQLMRDYECIVVPDGRCELETIALDELYFSAPSSHPQRDDCDAHIMEFLGKRLGI